ncbi:MAG: hypothetical protein AAF223_09925, partial [Bacteroidota bacterium]
SWGALRRPTGKHGGGEEPAGGIGKRQLAVAKATLIAGVVAGLIPGLGAGERWCEGRFQHAREGQRAGADRVGGEDHERSVIVEQLRHIEINQGAPQVAYKEAITNTVDHKEVYKKQTGGRGKFADIVFEIGPIDAEPDPKEVKNGLQFVNNIVGGVIPKEFIPAIQKGFEQAKTNGPLAGYPVEEMKVRLYHGSFHDVDSDALSFELAARLGFKEASKKAKPVLLEPIMSVEVVTPDEYTGSVTGDLNRRRGIMKGMDSKGVAQVIKADVPLSELFGYVTDLRTISSGRAAATLTFSHYDPVPTNIAETVIASSKGESK